MSGPTAFPAHGRPGSIRGAALLLVLWLLVLLTGLISVFALTSRTEALQGRFLGRSTAARLGAEAGIELAALHLQGADPATRWVPDGRVNEFKFEQQRIQVRVLDESAKIDLNVSAPDLLIGLFIAVGVDQERARQLSGAVLDWRDSDDLLNAQGGAEDPQYAEANLPYGAKDRPFETVSELRQVLGFDQALYENLLPHLTVFSGQARPSQTFASEPVLKALGVPALQIAQILAQRGTPKPDQPAPVLEQTTSLAAQGTGTYSISSRATRPDGTMVQIHATLRIGGGGGFGQLYLPLSWRVGESD
ncbi:MAG: general secretion pathway protein GspK [Arenimonas sp.]|nr:general secretion pathway protein GspK [Arenimonas sp.]